MEITETHCQMVGFISGRATVALTCNSDSWDVPPGNKDVIFENLFNTQSNKYLPLAVGIGTLRLAGWHPIFCYHWQSASVFSRLQSNIFGNRVASSS